MHDEKGEMTEHMDPLDWINKDVFGLTTVVAIFSLFYLVYRIE
jgi:hypothetical protein